MMKYGSSFWTVAVVDHEGYRSNFCVDSVVDIWKDIYCLAWPASTTGVAEKIFGIIVFFRCPSELSICNDRFKSLDCPSWTSIFQNISELASAVDHAS